MTNPSDEFNRYDTETLRDQMESLSPELREVVERRIEDILLDPRRYRDFGKGRYRGKKKVRLNRKDRLFFVFCEECRKFGHRSFNQCDDCENTPNNTVKFAFILFDHKY